MRPACHPTHLQARAASSTSYSKPVRPCRPWVAHLPPRQLSARRWCVRATCSLPRTARCSNRTDCDPTHPGYSLTYPGCSPMCSGCKPMHARLQPYTSQAVLPAARRLGGRRHLRARVATATTCRLACGRCPAALLLLRRDWHGGDRRHRRGQCGGWGAAGAAGAGRFLHVQRRQAPLRCECTTCDQGARVDGSTSCHLEGARKGSG